MKTNRSQAPWLAVLFAAWLAMPVSAHEGEDHSKDKKPPAAPLATAATALPAAGAAAREAPARLADGSLFVPKPVQHQLGLRTQRIVRGELATTVELNGRVIADPGAGGRIQASQPGTLQAGSRGFPAAGMKVREGEVLAWLKPSVSSLERAGQQAQQAELAAQLALARRRAERLAQLDGSVPAKDIEAAQIEAQALQQRLTATKTGLDTAQALLAPASGIVGAVHAAAGAVVDAKDILFEIVDPSRLAVEALAYDLALPARLAARQVQTGSAGDTRLQLRLTGAGLQLREQALPMVFAIVATSAPLAVGQPVQVLARTVASSPGMALPKSALSLNNAGETVVWVHTQAERFEPRRVMQRALDADTVALDSGVKPGERVVVSGATLLAQFR